MKKLSLRTIATLNVNRRNSIRPATVRHAFAFVSLVLACFGLSPGMQAGTSLGAGNTADGAGALQSLTTGIHNTAEGYQSLFSDTTNSYNTATGSQALKNNTGNANTADGFQALVKNTTGEANTATGWRALFLNTTGFDNTAEGYQALYSNTIGRNNTATGAGALQNNTTGITNTANGVSALQKDTTGTENTALGNQALQFNTTGNNNIAVGSGAGDQLTTGNNNIVIGNPGVTAETDTIRIGIGQSATFIAGIFGAVATGSQVGVDSNGHLGVLTVSSARFKDEIKPMDKASEVILALKPVTFRYKQEFDPKGIQQFGLVAEEVAKVNPALVTRDAKGEIYTVRYDAVNAMLLNEFLKEHCKVEEQDRKIQEQGATITQLKSMVAQQQKGMEALASSLKEQALQLRNVSAQVEMNKPAPQMVLNNH